MGAELPVWVKGLGCESKTSSMGVGLAKDFVYGCKTLQDLGFRCLDFGMADDYTLRRRAVRIRTQIWAQNLKGEHRT